MNAVRCPECGEEITRAVVMKKAGPVFVRLCACRPEHGETADSFASRMRAEYILRDDGELAIAT